MNLSLSSSSFVRKDRAFGFRKKPHITGYSRRRGQTETLHNSIHFLAMTVDIQGLMDGHMKLTCTDCRCLGCFHTNLSLVCRCPYLLSVYLLLFFDTSEIEKYGWEEVKSPIKVSVYLPWGLRVRLRWVFSSGGKTVPFCSIFNMRHECVYNCCVLYALMICTVSSLPSSSGEIAHVLQSGSNPRANHHC